MNKVYTIITENVIASLEKGTAPWAKSWKVTPQQNFVSRKPYRGINAFLLQMSEHETNYWATFKQIKGLGGNVKKGSKASQVVFYKKFEKKQDEEKKENEKKEYTWVLRYYNVFNLDQTTGIEIPKEEVIKFKPIEKCEEIVDKYAGSPKIGNGSDSASYSPLLDTITMPNKNSFDSVSEYYATLFHEMTHSTGHEKRLDRQTLTATEGFGSGTYSKEELVAEMGAAFLTTEAHIRNKKIEESEASYLAGWISRLENDHSLIVKAASQAQKATDHILGTDKANDPA